jgi:recombination protein RecA
MAKKTTKEDLSTQELMKLVESHTKVKGYLASDPEIFIDDISSGIDSLDDILHGNGWPRGRFCTIIGDYSTGKTWIILKTIADAQSKGYSTVFIDVEKTYDPDWATKVGVDNDKLIIFRPNTGEKAFDIINLMLDNNVDLIAVDSIAALTPTAEVDADMEQQFIGLQARMLGKGFRKSTGANNKSVVLMTNQLRAGIGGYVVKDVSPGGRGQNFYASIILRVTRHGFIREGGDDKDNTAARIGMYINAETIKNKVHPPFMSCTIPMLYTGGIDSIGMIYQIAMDEGIIERINSMTYGVEGEKIVGKLGVLNYLKDHPEVVEILREKIKSGSEIIQEVEE